MKKLSIIIISISILGLVSATNILAQNGMGGQKGKGMGKHANMQRMYDTKTVETINGEITSIDKMQSKNGKNEGIHLVLKTNNEKIPVHLGPSWFIDKQDIKFALNDKLSVKGSRVTYKDKPAIIAAEISKDGKTLKLRDDNGIPVWRGQNK